MIWKPNPGPQTRFLATTAHECLYGGAAGGGKSAALIALPLRWVHVPGFRALILRRESTQLVDLLDKAEALYPKAFPGARQNKTNKTWAFPSGATIRFNHCEHESDAAAYDGHEFQLVEFDELTHFTEKQYRAIRARIRGSRPGLPRYTRASTNPGGVGGEWVFRRFGPWLDPEYVLPGREPRFDADGKKLPPAAPGEVLWYIPNGDSPQWVPKGTPGALSRCFIPARLTDNPKLLEADPGYIQQLMDLDPVRRAQLLEGNWLVRPARGLYFKRAWFDIVDAAPAGAVWVRHWDRAATEAKPGKDPDWTVGLKLGRVGGDYYVGDVVRMRGTPGEVERTIKATAELDGKGVMIHLAQDPGQAGKFEADYYVRELAGYNVRVERETGDKVTRAQPVSAQAEAGNIKIVRGHWNEVLFQELEAFPEGHDDQVDALAGAFGALVNAVTEYSFYRVRSSRA